VRTDLCGARPYVMWSAPRHLLCPYDVDGLDDQVIEAAHQTHPFVAAERERPDEAALGMGSLESPRPFEGTLPTPRTPVREVSFAAGDLAGLRHILSAWTAEESLVREASEELVLAVNELATNSIRYGGGGGRLLLWREQDTLMCEVQDAGHIQDPLVGRSRPAPDEHTGRGLWLVNELCDLVQIRSSAEGTSVRVHKRLLPPS
jgi:anti-sigma regulatory factor (Ser/Thr protein kinase)